MSKIGFFEFLRLTRFAKPAHVRRLYRAIAERNVRRIVEIGLGDASRAKQMIALAIRSESEKKPRYTGIDGFETRPADASVQLSLKQAHSMLLTDGCDIRLVPGDMGSALTRCANELRGTDLIVISSDVPTAAVKATRHLLPRMMHKDSEVWIERDSTRFEVLGPADLRKIPKGQRAA